MTNFQCQHPRHQSLSHHSVLLDQTPLQHQPPGWLFKGGEGVGAIIQGWQLFEIFHQRGAINLLIIGGSRLIEGWLLFEEIWYTWWDLDVVADLNCCRRNLLTKQGDYYGCVVQCNMQFKTQWQHWNSIIIFILWKIFF